MIEHGGVFLPDGEQHLIEWMDKKQQWRTLADGRRVLGYQLHKLDACMKYVPENRRRLAIDVGAHVGLWSMHLTDLFTSVAAYEPIADHRDCFRENIPRCLEDGVVLLPYALGSVDGEVFLHTAPTSSGDTAVVPFGALERDLPKIRAEMRRLDSFNWIEVDFIKIDCEGYELEVLRGARQTVLDSRPVICVEQKPNKAESYGLDQKAAVAYLEGLGMRVAEELSGDFIMVWS